MSLPDILRPLFHNYRVESIDPERNADLVIKTVLADATGWEQVREVFRLYGWDRVKEAVLRDFHGLRELPESALRLWMVVFAPEEWRREEEENRALSERELARKKWGARRIPPKSLEEMLGLDRDRPVM